MVVGSLHKSQTLDVERLRSTERWIGIPSRSCVVGGGLMATLARLTSLCAHFCAQQQVQGGTTSFERQFP